MFACAGQPSGRGHPRQAARTLFFRKFAARQRRERALGKERFSLFCLRSGWQRFGLGGRAGAVLGAGSGIEFAAAACGGRGAWKVDAWPISLAGGVARPISTVRANLSGPAISRIHLSRANRPLKETNPWVDPTSIFPMT